MKQLVLLHGWAMHSKMWGDFAQKLSQHYCVTLIDLPWRDNLEAIADAVVGQLDDEPFYLLGWSFGGMVALKITERYANRVRGVMLIAANPCFVETENWSGMSQEAFNSFEQQLHENPDVTLQRFLALQVQGLPRFLKEIKNRFAMQKMPEFIELEASLALLKNSDLRYALRNLTCPVAAILSDNDMIVPVSVNQPLQALNPNLKITILNNAGHIPFVTQTENCLNTVHVFFDGF